MSLSYRNACLWSIVSALVASWMMAAPGFAQTIFIPSLSVSETYDSNVFSTPKTLLGPEFKPEDFFTTLTPQINMAHAGPLLNGSLSVGANVARYVNNPNLDYTGYNAAGQLDLKRWANNFSQRISALSVRGAYQFTPSMSGFGPSTSGGSGGLGWGYGATSIGSPLDIGLVTNRVSMHNINLGIAGAYNLTRTTSLTTSYNFTKVTFGNQSGGINNVLFDTQGHTVMTGLNTRITPTDTVGTTATMSAYLQGQANGGGSGTFTTISGMLTWSKLWSQRMNSSVAVGGLFTLPIESTVPGQSTKLTVTPTGTATLNYSSLSEGLRAAGSSPGPFDNLPRLAGSLSPGGVIAPGAYTAAMSYTASVYPSYGFGAGPMQTHIVGVNAGAGITSKLTGRGGLNYSHGSTSSPSSTFDTLGVTVGTSYLLGPVLLNLTYNWLYFVSSAAQSAATQSEYAFSKKMVMLSLSYAFTSQSFFRMGGLGSFASQSSSDGVTVPSDAGAESGSSGAGVLKKE